MTTGYPEHFYKFRSGNDCDVINVINQQWWIPSTESLNDPHEARINIDVINSLENPIPMSELVLHSPNGEPVLGLMGMYGSPRYENIDEKRESLKNQVESIFSRYSSMGIYSVSDTWNNVRMWSLYANSFKGFCIEYKLRNSEGAPNRDLDCFCKVEYLSEYRTVDYNRLVRCPPDRQNYLIACQKSDDWAYEREWRCILETSDHTIDSPFEVNSILVGHNTPESLILRLREGLPSIPLKQVSTNQNGYGLAPELTSL